MGRRVYHTPSATFWRSVDGLWRDLLSLPGRLCDPVKRQEPWQTIHHVGGDYSAAGQVNVEILIKLGQLRYDDRVLDIGCGNGRVAWPLSQVLASTGEYVGFDVSWHAIRYCKRHISSLWSNFTFYHLDIRNGVYNPNGLIEESEALFPCEDETVTLAFATSVLTHLSWPAVHRYFQEIQRVLVPGGRALLTAFVLTPEVRMWALEGRTSLSLQPFGEHAMTSDLHWPENAMAYDESELRAVVASAGLQLKMILAGQWRPEPSYFGGQDLLMVVKP